MDVVVDRFRPTPTGEMKALQKKIASAAIFEDRMDLTAESIRTGEHIVAGIDQAFVEDRAVSAVVVVRGGEVIARESAVTPISMPYVPGLLAFREGEPIVAALEALEVTPDLLVFDGGGRIHYREAGIATHVGVCFDVPSIGVTKTLLCGRPREPIDDLEEGDAVPIEADGSMETEGIVGYAYQSRQYPNSTRINPIYISPGHRLSARTALECVIACGGEYKLPRPIRLADRDADELKSNREPIGGADNINT